MSRISPVALGLSLGIVWGVSVMVMALVAYYFTYGTAFVVAMGGLYVGYEATLIGSLIGGLLGFVDAFILGVVVAWLYNVFSGCSHRS